MVRPTFRQRCYSFQDRRTSRFWTRMRIYSGRVCRTLITFWGSCELVMNNDGHGGSGLCGFLIAGCVFHRRIRTVSVRSRKRWVKRSFNGNQKMIKKSVFGVDRLEDEFNVDNGPANEKAHIRSAIVDCNRLWEGPHRFVRGSCDPDISYRHVVSNLQQHVFVV